MTAVAGNFKSLKKLAKRLLAKRAILGKKDDYDWLRKGLEEGNPKAIRFAELCEEWARVTDQMYAMAGIDKATFVEPKERTLGCMPFERGIAHIIQCGQPEDQDIMVDLMKVYQEALDIQEELCGETAA